MLQYRDLMDETHTRHGEILIVEDEADIARLMALHLRAAGFSTVQVEDGDEALRLLREDSWRLVVLDRMLPGASGMRILRWLRSSRRDKYIPVLMVTALGLPTERVAGLNEGADDYLPKPFEPEELVARARALLRRSQALEPAGMNAGRLRLDEDAPVVYDGDKRAELRPLEYRLLKVLMDKPGKTRSREWLLDHVWGQDVFIEPRTVDVTVKRLRKALKALGHEHCIETVRGMGYRYLERED
ncbi:MAG: response regulator [Zetaproteobacteria bacterium]|nr:MAG: response regulator [Zetaproteobacteria bacterium]